MLEVGQLVAAISDRHPLALEDAFHELVATALAEHEVVLVDDLHLLANVICAGHMYPRSGLLSAPLASLNARARATNRTLGFAATGLCVSGVWSREQMTVIRELTVDDYGQICRAHLKSSADTLDFDHIFRFARKLSATQLTGTCATLRAAATVTTEAFLEHLRAYHSIANVDLREVQTVDLRDLKGLDDVLEALEANVVLPLENTALAAELGLRPKRGVLLAGPPGTGKTTIGRALAHRLQSKFFLVDGTVVSGSSSFFESIHRIFDAAKRSAPAIIFIDDSDVLFEGSGDTGFYRYLLTMLDGIESEGVGHICLVMTAMDVGNMPPALVRSGRIELWLEMRLPNEEARAAILSDRCADLPAAVRSVDIPRLARETEGLSGADLRRLVEDGKLLFAYDRARERPALPVTEYFLRAVETLRGNKARYQAAEARARARGPGRPAHFDGMTSFTMLRSTMVEGALVEGFDGGEIGQ